MPPPASPATEPPAAGALLTQKLVGRISGRFVVRGYQRGYRWTKEEVGRLLQDIHDNGDNDYSLQPVVVKWHPPPAAAGSGEPGEWELVDGQQRLTTLYLIFLYIQRAHLPSSKLPYSIRFETRPGSDRYLQTLDPAESTKYIDFSHLYAAYTCISEWFEAQEDPASVVVNDFYRHLFKFVRVIWYQAPADLDAITLFTRLNVGRIPLTDAELVKALLLTSPAARADGANRVHELAANWDDIERSLREPEIWGFITDAAPEDYPTHITLLLDVLAGDPPGRGPRPRYYTFDRMREQMESDGPLKVWERVVDLHAQILGWFDQRDHYHKIGYLVAAGRPLADLIRLAADRTKKQFEAELDTLIRGTLNLTADDVAALDYENRHDREKCSRLLLLLNVETVRRAKDSNERYSFRAHGRVKNWSLEHIHAQRAATLNTVPQWTEWLQLHRAALGTLPGVDPMKRDTLIARIDAALAQVTREKFTELAEPIAALFVSADDKGKPFDWVQSIANLVLLPGGENSALGNSVFEVKRQHILESDRAGAYIPVCTRNVFLKYYTSADAQQIHFWSPQDRQAYLDAMFKAPAGTEPGGMIYPYLQPATPQP